MSSVIPCLPACLTAPVCGTAGSRRRSLIFPACLSQVCSRPWSCALSTFPPRSPSPLWALSRVTGRTRVSLVSWIAASVPRVPGVSPCQHRPSFVLRNVPLPTRLISRSGRWASPVSARSVMCVVGSIPCQVPPVSTSEQSPSRRSRSESLVFQLRRELSSGVTCLLRVPLVLVCVRCPSTQCVITCVLGQILLTIPSDRTLSPPSFWEVSLIAGTATPSEPCFH